MTLNTVLALAQNDKLAGHVFIKPCLWYGRQIQKLVAPWTTPEVSWNRVIEIALRVRILALVVLVPLFAAAFLIGIAVKKIAPVAFNPAARELHQIGEQLDASLSDLPSLHGEAGNVLERSITAFEKKYVVPGSSPPLEFTLIEDYQNIKSVFVELRKMREGLFFTEVYINDEGIMQQPEDGNCFFHALGKGLILISQQLVDAGTWFDINLDHESFRKAVVEWMRKSQDPVLKKYIDEAIEGYVATRKTQYQQERQTLVLLQIAGENVTAAIQALDQEEQKLNGLLHPQIRYHLYYEKIGTIGFFASKAEIYAVSQMFKVAIHIERKIGERNLGEVDPPINPHYPLKITLTHVNGKHFDLKVI